MWKSVSTMLISGKVIKLNENLKVEKDFRETQVLSSIFYKPSTKRKEKSMISSRQTRLSKFSPRHDSRKLNFFFRLYPLLGFVGEWFSCNVWLNFKFLVTRCVIFRLFKLILIVQKELNSSNPEKERDGLPNCIILFDCSIIHKLDFRRLFVPLIKWAPETRELNMKPVIFIVTTLEFH